MKIKLTDRLQAIADFIIPNEGCADIGTDHGYIPAYLYERDFCNKIILTDANAGPLEKARENLSLIGVKDSDLRLGNGLEVLDAAEVSTVVIAGMGGELIEQIIGADLAKSKSFKKFILQPRTKCDELRIWLADHNFKIEGYKLAVERGRICEIFSVVPSTEKIEECKIISDVLVNSKDPLLKEFVTRKIDSLSLLIQSLEHSKSDEIEKTEIALSNKKYLQNILEILA